MKKIVLLSMVLAIFAVAFVSALPTGPTTDITPIGSERLDTWGPRTVVALAGNITEFNTDTSSITRTWQGYFGNVTGTIVLGDANNNTLYDWSVSNPQGEIYAVRSATVPSWTTTRCSTAAELEAEDLALGVDAVYDEDAVNRTFAVTGTPEAQANFGGALSHPTFYVASSEILADSCAVTYLYTAGAPNANFRQVILSDDNTVPIIYTAFLAHTFNPFAESTGFDGDTHDFQMIVGEDGHGTDIATSTYYFYLELE
ncbi:MAG: hypothetical protein ACP5NV_03735 [Candidatus Woesearchaeota archaeon]